VGRTFDASLATTVMSSLLSADAKRAFTGETGAAWPRPAAPGPCFAGQAPRQTVLVRWLSHRLNARCQPGIPPVLQ